MMKRIAPGIFVLVICCLSLPAIAAETATGRYVHVAIPGQGKTLSLAEVQVFSGGENVAIKQPAVQTTTSQAGLAGRAVDGDTNGEWRDGSVTHTTRDGSNPAWEVDLGKDRPIEKVIVWNRNSIMDRLYGARVSILNGHRKVVWGATLAKPGRVSELVIAKAPACSWAGTAIEKIVPGRVEAVQPPSKGRTKAKRAPKERKPAPPDPVISTGTPKSLRLAIQDLIATYGGRYPGGEGYLQRLDAVEAKIKAGDAAAQAEFDALQSEALLANPLLDFDKLLVIKRKGSEGLPANWLGNCSLPRGKYDDEIAVLSPIGPEGKLTTLYKPPNKEYVGDVDLHFSAEKLLFSSIGTNNRWQVFEIGIDGKGLRQVSKGDASDVDNYDAVYLPNGRIIFCSTANYHSVPCIGGKQPVGNLCSMDADGSNVRQLCFEQDHDWYPTVLPSGRVMYTRWEYSDTPHYFTRLVMTMYPDGSNQQALYGSNSYWPNSVFYGRPIPGGGGPSEKFVGIVSGHHGGGRYGELVLFDPSRSQHEAKGVIQRIPGYQQPVEPVIVDRLITNVWPKFLHPWPLSEKHFLVSCKLTSRGRDWGVWLVDIYDNMIPVCVLDDAKVFEPVPLVQTPKPPVLAPRVETDRKDSVVFLVDIYRGPGLKGIRRGAVKNLRVMSFHFAYNFSGGHSSVGEESGWDIKRILGTVPVEADGSALFRIPSNTPIAVQPLDEKGQALQLMRSWFVGMPGETLSCVGCHEPGREAPPAAPVGATVPTALKRDPSEIAPWLGPARPMSFTAEVQPVLDKYCVGCHNGEDRSDGRKIHNFAQSDPSSYAKDVAYQALHPYVRRPGPESDYYVLKPMEYHASSSELFQMLEKGHHNVKLDDEAWQRLTCWVDLNVPHRGQWAPAEYAGQDQTKRRLELAKLYANLEHDPEDEFREALAKTQQLKITPVMPEPEAKETVKAPKVAGWPFDPDQAARLQKTAGSETAATIDLGDGVKMEMVLVPAGEFAMGSANGFADEAPMARVKIDQPFWMGVCEVTNRQFNAFDVRHDSRFIDQQWKDHALPGYPANRPDQPVIRITWREARAFCRWLSAKTGKQFSLPSEAQWEWACRAGSDGEMSYGAVDADFGKLANLADTTMRLFAVKGVNPQPVANPPAAMAFLPRINGVNDGQMIGATVGGYEANAWGLKDMHGNVAEWTSSALRPYPYDAADGREDADGPGKRVVRGGSWRDRPQRARAAFRLGYLPSQPVFNVGFRVVCKP